MEPNAYDQIKLVNFLHKVPRFPFLNNVELIVTEDRWDYVCGTLVLPACLAVFFFVWAIVLVIKKCTAVRSTRRRPSKEKKRTECRCHSTASLTFLWSFILMALCSFLYTNQGALKTKESFYQISDEVKEFEKIVNRTNEIMMSLVSLQEKAASFSVELIYILNSTLYDYNDIVDFLDDLDADMIDKIADVDIGALLDDKIGENDAHAMIIDALLKNASGLDAFIADTSVDVSKFDEIDMGEVIAFLGASASELDEIEEIHNVIGDMDIDTLKHDEIVGMLDATVEKKDLDKIIADMDVNASNYVGIEGLNTTVAGMSTNTSKNDERDGLDVAGGFRSLLSHVDTQLLTDEKVKVRRLLAHLGINASNVRQLKNVDHDIHELIIKTIEELSSLNKLSEVVLLDSSSVFERVTSVIYAVNKNLIKLGNYIQMTSFGIISVLFLPICLIVGLGLGCTRDQPSKIDKNYGSFLSWLVLPTFILVISCCIISSMVLGFVAIVTADVCASKEGLITKVMVEKGMESTDFFYLMMEYYIMSSCLRPSMIGIDHLILQIEQAIIDSDTISSTMDTACNFVDCTTINELVNSLVNVLTAVTIDLMDTNEIIKCEGINSIYTVIVRDEMCANSLTGMVWMYSMLLLISLFGMVMITLRDVVWISLVAKIAPTATTDELANLTRSNSRNTGDNNIRLPPLEIGGTNTAKQTKPKNNSNSEIMDESQNSKHRSKHGLKNRDMHSITIDERGSNRGRHSHSLVSNRGPQRSRKKPKYNINREIVRESQNSKNSSKNDSVKTKDWEYTIASARDSNGGSHSPTRNSGSQKSRAKPKYNINREIVTESQNSKHSTKHDSVKTEDWDFTTTSDRGSNSRSHSFSGKRSKSSGTEPKHNRGSNGRSHSFSGKRSKSSGTEPKHNQPTNTGKESLLKQQQVRQSSTKVVLGGVDDE